MGRATLVYIKKSIQKLPPGFPFKACLLSAAKDKEQLKKCFKQEENVAQNVRNTEVVSKNLTSQKYVTLKQ